MNRGDLSERVLSTALKHLLYLENNMLALLPKIKKGNEEAIKRYEWYMQATKQMGIKDLAVLAKTMAPQEEVSGIFEGFDDD